MILLVPLPHATLCDINKAGVKHCACCSIGENSDAQKHIILLEVKGIVPSPIRARYMYGHEPGKPQDTDSVCIE